MSPPALKTDPEPRSTTNRTLSSRVARSSASPMSWCTRLASAFRASGRSMTMLTVSADRSTATAPDRVVAPGANGSADDIAEHLGGRGMRLAQHAAQHLPAGIAGDGVDEPDR